MSNYNDLAEFLMKYVGTVNTEFVNNKISKETVGGVLQELWKTNITEFPKLENVRTEISNTTGYAVDIVDIIDVMYLIIFIFLDQLHDLKTARKEKQTKDYWNNEVGHVNTEYTTFELLLLSYLYYNARINLKDTNAVTNHLNSIWMDWIKPQTRAPKTRTPPTLSWNKGKVNGAMSVFGFKEFFLRCYVPNLIFINGDLLKKIEEEFKTPEYNALLLEIFYISMGSASTYLASGQINNISTKTVKRLTYTSS